MKRRFRRRGRPGRRSFKKRGRRRSFRSYVVSRGGIRL